MMEDKKYVVLGAYSCAPNSDSEPGVAWDQVVLLSKMKQFEFLLVTREKRKLEIECALLKERISNVKVLGVDLPRWLLFWKKGHLAMHIYYYVWQLLAYFKVSRISKYRNIVLAHHISFMSIRSNFIPFLNMKSIVGPVGGAQLPPHGFNNEINNGLKARLRTFSIKSMRYSPLWRVFISRIDLLILANRDNLWLIPPSKRKVAVIHQIGWESTVPKITRESFFFESGSNSSKGKPVVINFLWCGRLIKWKGLEVALKAFSILIKESIDIKCQLQVVGKGPDKEYFKSIATDLGIEDDVIFFGYVEDNVKKELFHESDICLFTSLHETTGTTFFEYLDYAKPVIALRHAGPRDIIDACGAVGVNVDSGFEKTILNFAHQMHFLAHDEALCKEIGIKGKSALEYFYSIERHANFFDEIYRDMISD